MIYHNVDLLAKKIWTKYKYRDSNLPIAVINDVMCGSIYFSSKKTTSVHWLTFILRLLVYPSYIVRFDLFVILITKKNEFELFGRLHRI